MLSYVSGCGPGGKMKPILVKGSEAIALGALAADCRCYFGYPITPQNEIPELMARELPKRGGVFLQAESELAAVNMLLGAASTGVRAMTSSSSPGISLMAETFSYLAALELPAVIVNVSRGGPGLGGIEASQGDYFQATRGAGHGDYHFLVLSPASIQEAYELTARAFELAERYRQPAMILTDALLGQMKEPLRPRKLRIRRYPVEDWALTGAKGRPGRTLRSLFLGPGELRARNLLLQKKYRAMRREARAEVLYAEGAELAVTAFGSLSRIVREAVEMAREKGYSVAFVRPITLFPFPERPYQELSARGVPFLVVELNCGQMVEDVKLAVCGRAEVESWALPPSDLPAPEDIYRRIRRCLARR
ncbi:3-methyl-2-oxobutanoate dehydrogenase subunit VorB [Thermosulfurimonas marina]|uniref:3-methyl-2-oxobutanoate dehydrogenase subunit VorB n=2 Tax=Thermosulfurimonas marina TaxID=2047767 RepID=A0A6H1WUU3_9BACT|nr:3-methyl-2-oxobutanoate dehydrogenase subunit VorB [Thermosulfurimonas marina]